MKASNFRDKSKLPENHLALSERLRERRMAKRFSQQALADEVNVTKSAVANCEYGRARLQLGVGLEISRRLDINQRWLATGEGWNRPHVQLSELGIDEERTLGNHLHSVDFIDGYNRFLKKPLEAWAASNSKTDILERHTKTRLSSYLHGLSLSQLHDELIQHAQQAKTVPADVKESYLKLVEELAREARSRWSKKLLK